MVLSHTIFLVSLILLDITFLRFTCVVYINSLCLLWAELSIPQCIYPFDGHLGCFYVIVILNNITINVHNKFLWIYMFISLSRNVNVDCMVSVCLTIRNSFLKQLYHTFWLEVYKILVPKHPCQHLIWSVILILVIL